jgi:excisionase family DNA binding protein
MISRPKKNVQPQNVQNGEHRLVSVARAAQLLACSEWYVRQRIWEGSLPFVRLGNKVRIDLQDLEQYVAAHKECNALPAMPVTTHGL